MFPRVDELKDEQYMDMPGTETLRLEDEQLISHGQTLQVDDLPLAQPNSTLTLRNASPIVERLWGCAVADLEANIISRDEIQYFAAGGRGAGWDGRMFVRDTSLAGILGLNRLFPELMLKSQILMRERFFERLWNTPRDHVFGWQHLTEEVEDLGLAEYADKYCFSPPMRCTDDVVWVWCMADLLERMDAPGFRWQWFLDTAERCFSEFYDYFLAEEDGLYRGQSIFMDIGWQGYPPSFGRIWPRSYARTPEPYRRTVELKASSTNAAYVAAMDRLAQAAGRLGKAKTRDLWRARGARLRTAIRNHLRRDDGTFAVYKHVDGTLEPRQDALGTALLVLSETVLGDEADEAIRNYPVTGWGVPLLYPFFDNKEPYHNKAAWPFVDGFFLHAREHALGTDESALHFALLARSCLGGDTFREFIDLRNGKPGGSSAQLWSAAAFIGRCEQEGFIAHSSQGNVQTNVDESR